MRVLLTGAAGQLGSELARDLSSRAEVTAVDHGTLDLTDSRALAECIRGLRPAVIVNAAAYTAVDRAESESERALAVNGVAPGILGEEAKRLGALLVHYSTDYVFDGAKRRPYVETDEVGPLSSYGRSKLEGERRISGSGCRALVLRTSWVYGNGRNFVRTVLDRAKRGESLRVVNDQHGAPTWARDLSRLTAALLWLRNPPEGIFHAAAAGMTTWHGVAEAVLRHAGLHSPLTAIRTGEFPVSARRPAWSVLDSSRLEQETGLSRIGLWEERLQAYIASA